MRPGLRLGAKVKTAEEESKEQDEIAQNAAGHHRAKGETASKTGEARVR